MHYYFRADFWGKKLLGYWKYFYRASSSTPTKILKTQLASHSTIQTDYTTKNWEIIFCHCAWQIVNIVNDCVNMSNHSKEQLHWQWMSFLVMWLVVLVTFQVWVSFAEYSLFDRALLQKRLMILGSLLIVATPWSRVTSLAVTVIFLYGMAATSRLLKIIGLFCKRDL